MSLHIFFLPLPNIFLFFETHFRFAIPLTMAEKLDTDADNNPTTSEYSPEGSTEELERISYAANIINRYKYKYLKKLLYYMYLNIYTHITELN